MGFGKYSTPYDWSRVAAFRVIASKYPGGAVDLSVGSPVDSVAQGVQDALTEAANARNAYGYPATVGTPELRQSITDWYKRTRGVDLESIDADVVPSVGSKEAVALMASMLHLHRGDVVVQPRVSYPTYSIGTQLAGATVHYVDAVEDTQSWEGVRNVKAVWVNSPNNPSGKVLNEFQLHDIIVAARKIGAVVLSDECYALLRWNPDLAAGMDAGSVDTLADNAASSALRTGVCSGSAHGILSLYSLSKQSNMAGYRTAFIAGDSELVKEMSAMRKQIGLIIPGPVQAAMTYALGDDESVVAQRRRYSMRLRALVDGLRTYGYADAAVPQGGLYIWVKALGDDCWDDMGQLARLGIVPSPGEFYGDKGYLRFSVTASDEAVNRAAHRLREKTA